jgi:hypothetical protein
MKTVKIGVNIQQVEGFKAFTPLPFPPKGGFDFNTKGSRLDTSML